MDIKNILKYDKQQFDEWYEKSFKAVKNLNEMYKVFSEIPRKNPFINYDNLPENCTTYEDILKQHDVINPDFSSFTSIKREIEYTEEALKCLENIRNFYCQQEIKETKIIV
jgi:hypothetical protein